MYRTYIFRYIAIILIVISSLILLAKKLWSDEGLKFTNTGFDPLNGGIIEEVNLFTGDFEAQVYLFDITSRVGLSFSIRLVYNSNIHETVDENNKNKQAPWVGLGWNLDIPYIWRQASINEQWYISGNKSNELIHVSGGQYKLQDYRYWKITCISREQGWEILTEDGTKYKYGHKRYLTYRYYQPWPFVIGYEESVGYRWDLTEIEDVYGNKITIEYYDVKEKITDWINPWDPETMDNYSEYIKMSYIKKVIDNATGKVVIFNRIDRNDYEDGWEGPYGLEDDPPNKSDSYEEFFATERLESIRGYDKDPDIYGYNNVKCIKHIQFGYDYIDYTGGSKLRLRSITYYDPQNSSDNLPATKFEYYSSAENNPGGLKKVVYPDGGEKLIQYESRNDNSTSWRVDWITLYDKMENSYQTDYTWPTATYYEDGNYYGHSWVKVNLPGSSFGEIKYTHETQESTHLVGMLKKVENYKEGTTTSKKTVDNTWQADDKGDDCYYKRLQQKIITIDNITATTSYGYNSLNGMVNEITETNTDNTIRKTETTYAFEKFSGMNADNKHMLSQTAQQTVYLTSVSPNNARSSSVTTWKDWGNGKWAPRKTYQWLENDGSYSLPTFDFNNWSDNGEPTSEPEWVRTSKILSMDSFGNLLEVEDANGNMNSTIWGYNNSLPIASCFNGNKEEFSYTSFENNESNGWLHRESQRIIYYDAHTGTMVARVYTVDGDQYGPTNYFYETEGLNADTCFYASIWVKGPNTARLVIKINNDNNLTDSKFCSGSGEWELLTVKLPKSMVTQNMDGDDYIVVFVANNNTTPAYFDDIMFYPGDGNLSVNVYDPETNQVVAETDVNNIPIIYKYDQFNRLIETWNCDNKLLTYNSYYYSRDGNNDQFNSQDPNYVKSISIPAEGFWEGFRYLDSPANHGWSIYDGSGTMSTVYDNSLKSQVLRTETTNNPSTLFGIRYPSTGALDNESRHLWVKIKDTNNFIFYVRVKASDQDEYYIRYEPNDGTPYYSAGYIYHYLGTEYKDGTWCIFERDLANDLQATTETANLEFEYVRWFCIRGDYDMDDIRLTDEPVTSMTFADGLGRQIQAQTWNDDYDIVSKTVYNNIGKVEKQYKPQEISNTDHDFITSVSSVYELFEYFDDPLARLKKQTHCGGSSWINFDYNSESFNGYTYRYEKITDEEGKIRKNYFDRFGNNVGNIAAEGTGDQIQWVYDYDILGNVTRIKPPNYFNPPTGTVADNWDSEMSYNTIGQLIQEYTPDENATRFIYDKNGNLRYSQDAKQTSNGDFTVYYYDEHERLVLTGEEIDDYNWTTIPPSLDNSTYGKEANEWKIKYYYDENFVTGASNYCQGKLSKTEVNDDADDTVEHITKYVYDKFGNLVEKRITIDGGSPITEKVISHSYDQLGKEIQLEYPSGNTVARQYDFVGRLKKVYTVQ